MPYEVLLGSAAQEAISRQPPEMQSEVILHLEWLAEAPVERSEPSYLPWPPEFQMYRFRLVWDGRAHEFIVLFKYGADEQTLHVYRVGHIDRGPM